MRRVFALDVLECRRCHGPMKSLAAIHPPDTAGAILEYLGLAARPPPLGSPPRAAGARLFDPDSDWSRDSGKHSLRERCPGAPSLSDLPRLENPPSDAVPAR